MVKSKINRDHSNKALPCNPNPPDVDVVFLIV
jgi:hypothetical protein